MTHNPMIYYAISERLSQLENQWRPFDAQWMHRFFYRKAANADDSVSNNMQDVTNPI
jgi:hypothetical protein